MAILLVNVEDNASLKLNEFFDYNGHCYAVSCRRDQVSERAMDFSDFYDSTVATGKKSDVTVVFCEKEADKVYLLGWYKNAEIYSRSKYVTMFLQGNIVANSSEVIYLGNRKYVEGLKADFSYKNYEVVEMEDSRYDILTAHIYTFNEKYNVFSRYPYIHVQLDPRARKNFDISMKYCESISGAIMGDRCQGVAEIKALYQYATEAANTDKKSTDGFYYLAMACYHLGFTKEGIKAIEKALKIEPDAADINAMKANLLLAMGYYDSAAELYHRAAELCESTETVGTAGGVETTGIVETTDFGEAETEQEHMSDIYAEHEKRVLSIKHQNSFCTGF